MTKRLVIVACLALLSGLLAACGGGTKNVPSDAVALVNGDSITKAQFNSLIDATAKVARRGMRASGGAGATSSAAPQRSAASVTDAISQFESREKNTDVVVELVSSARGAASPVNAERSRASTRWTTRWILSGRFQAPIMVHRGSR